MFLHFFNLLFAKPYIKCGNASWQTKAIAIERTLYYAAPSHAFPRQFSVPYFYEFNMDSYYMAVSHKDWELPNPRIWLAEIDIKSGLDFPI